MNDCVWDVLMGLAHYKKKSCNECDVETISPYSPLSLTEKETEKEELERERESEKEELERERVRERVRVRELVNVVDCYLLGVMMLFSCFMSRVKEPSKTKEGEKERRKGSRERRKERERKENTLKILSRSEIVTSIGGGG